MLMLFFGLILSMMCVIILGLKNRQTVVITFSARPSWGLSLQRYCRTKGVSRSRFIRDAVNAALLKDGAAGALVEHLGVPQKRFAIDGEPRCNPWLSVGCCLTCWPDGEPPKEDWQ